MYRRRGGVEDVWGFAAASGPCGHQANTTGFLARSRTSGGGGGDDDDDGSGGGDGDVIKSTHHGLFGTVRNDGHQLWRLLFIVVVVVVGRVPCLDPREVLVRPNGDCVMCHAPYRNSNGVMQCEAWGNAGARRHTQ